MVTKRILNPTTGKYYKLRQKTTASGTAGQIMGLWSPKRTVKSKREGLKTPDPDSTWGKILKGKCPYKKGHKCPWDCHKEDDEFCGEYNRMKELGYEMPGDHKPWIKPWKVVSFDMLTPPLSEKNYDLVWEQKVEIINGDVYSNVPRDHWSRKLIEEQKQFLTIGLYVNEKHPKEVVRIYGHSPDLTALLFKRK